MCLCVCVVGLKFHILYVQFLMVLKKYSLKIPKYLALFERIRINKCLINQKL